MQPQTFQTALLSETEMTDLDTSENLFQKFHPDNL